MSIKCHSTHLETFEFAVEKVKLSHVHSEPLLRVCGVVLSAAVGRRHVHVARDLLRRGGHRRLALEQLRSLAKDNLGGGEKKLGWY
jgi:hypothetical protein